jgi:hypothetical protein
MQSDSIKELAGALAKAQLAIKGAVKDSENPFFKAAYADLASVWNACREPLGSNGLSVVQIPNESSELVIIETILMHSSGEWISGKISMKPVKTDPQSIGSCITYARRYALSAIVGIAPLDDDDANAASDKKEPEKRPPEHSPKQERKDSPPDDKISEPQKKRFWAIAKGQKVSDEDLKKWLLDNYQIEHTADIPKSKYQEICEEVVKCFPLEENK